jgi:hypothetical protein
MNSLWHRRDDVNEHVKKTFLCFDPRSRDSSAPTIGGHAMEWDDLSTPDEIMQKSDITLCIQMGGYQDIIQSSECISIARYGQVEV